MELGTRHNFAVESRETAKKKNKTLSQSSAIGSGLLVHCEVSVFWYTEKALLKRVHNKN